MADSKTLVVNVSRWFDATPEQVFDAWLNPAIAGMFLFRTPKGELTTCEIDARIGGRYTITEMRDGKKAEHTGRYLELDRPNRLVFTLDDTVGFQHTTVFIDIIARANGCELNLRHEGVLASYETSVNRGWTGILEGVALLMSTHASPTKRIVTLEHPSDCEMKTSRLLDAPRELVWRAWSDPAQLAHWYGPNGFTITTHEMQFKKGGFWKLTMHGPDGRDYKNKIVFLEITEPERMVYKHAGEAGDEPVTFQTTVTFEELGPKLTRLSMHAVFDSAASLKHVIDTYGADKGAMETIARLGEWVESQQ